MYEIEQEVRFARELVRRYYEEAEYAGEEGTLADCDVYLEALGVANDVIELVLY